MEPMFFPDPLDFREWLDKNHAHKTELLVGFYKVGSGKPSMSWPESVDQAICYGWIDGVRRSIDEHSYSIRFTPRKATSIWSNINIKKVEDLTKKGLMQPAGITAFGKRTEGKSGIYSFEKDPVCLSEEFEQKFKANEKAWDYFNSMPPGYKKTAIHIVMSAKQGKTRQSRLDALIKDSEEGNKLKSLRY